MFDFTDLFTSGREVEAHGKKWVLLKSLYKNYWLAAEIGVPLPMTPMVIEWKAPPGELLSEVESTEP